LFVSFLLQTSTTLSILRRCKKVLLLVPVLMLALGWQQEHQWRSVVKDSME
jgi:hypothetical protein